MLSAQVILSFFSILALSSLTVFAARKVKMPHTVFLVVVGIGLGILSYSPLFSFLNHLELTPSLLFYLLLPTLIFESAYAMSARKLADNAMIVMLLSIVSLIISAFVIAGLLALIFPALGFEIPFMFLLLFGALISATDPVAVLALFKEYGAPERLSLIFEGESLFNDATAVAFFLIVLGVVAHGFLGPETIFVGIGQFLFMMVGGILFGVFMGLLFAGLVGYMRENEMASITLTIVLAHLTFIFSDVLSHHIFIGEHEFPLSPIIATTIASLIMGNYGRAKLHPQAEAFVSRLWGELAFMANSVIFVLIGLLVVRSEIWKAHLAVPILLTVLVVAFARTLSIYPVTGIFNIFVQKKDRIPTTWSHLLSWGSLRGALAITMVLLVPPDLSLPNWPLAATPQEFLLALTVGCICATLFVKATTIRTFMRKLGLDARDELEEFEYHEAHSYIHAEVARRVEQYFERGYITKDSCDTIKNLHEAAHDRANASIRELSAKDEETTDRVLRMYAIGIEIAHLKELYRFGEVNEHVYRRILTKLTLQIEALEHGDLNSKSVIHTDGLDIFERLYYRIKRFFVTPNPHEEILNAYRYYRAQSIIARKVLKELEARGIEHAQKVFADAPLARVTRLYETYKTQTNLKAEALRNEHPELVDPLNHKLALRGAGKVASVTLENLEENLLVTKNVSITMKHELERMHES